MDLIRRLGAWVVARHDRRPPDRPDGPGRIGLLRRAGMWICYRMAVRHQQRGTRPVAPNPHHQEHLDRLWGSLMRGIVDDWQRRPRLFRP